MDLEQRDDAPHIHMPEKIPVTVGGIGPLRGLHLDFSREDWAHLLYDTPPESPSAG